MKFRIMSIVMLGLLIVGMSGRSAFGSNLSFPVIDPIDAPFSIPSLQPPNIPDYTVNIVDFGAKGDGRTLNTRAIAAAIHACAAHGGGRVLVPAGDWLTGPIHLQSNINLHFEKGARLTFSTRFEDYLPAVFTRKTIECYSLSPLIYARNCSNIAITGPGELEGLGDVWARMPGFGAQSSKHLNAMVLKGVPVEQRILDTYDTAVLPAFIEPVNCTNVYLQGFTVKNGPTWIINPVYCENVIMSELRVLGEHPPNNKANPPFHVHNGGINPNSSRNVLIEDCYISTGDDGIVMKSGLDEDGWRVGRPCENVVVRRCEFQGDKTFGAMAIGSEISGGVRNVLVEACRFENTTRCFRLKSRRGRGGIVENIWIRNITVGRLRVGPVIWLETSYGIDRPDWGQPRTDKPPLFRNISVTNVTCEFAPRSIEISGLPEQFIENASFENVSITANQGFSCTYGRHITMKDVRIMPKDEPVLKFVDSKDIVLDHVACPQGMDYLEVQGALVQNIRVRHVDGIAPLEDKITIRSDVPADAVIIE